MKRSAPAILLTIILIAAQGLMAVPASAQYPQPSYPGQAPPWYPPHELDRMVSRIALYPDPLLAQVLAAATFAEEIPDAADWADQHSYLRGGALARAIEEDRVPWDPSVQALLPFPSVLDMMASDMNWTSELGDAFLAQSPEVMEAVQRMRRQAYRYGYLRSNRWITVRPGTYIQILVVNPGYIVVPSYNPRIVFAPPRRGVVIGGVINFGSGISIGVFFRRWGWGYNRFAWNTRTVIINNHPWRRHWQNRRTYVHPYSIRRYQAPRRPERHELRQPAPRRQAPGQERRRVEERPRGTPQGRAESTPQRKSEGKSQRTRREKKNERDKNRERHDSSSERDR